MGDKVGDKKLTLLQIKVLAEIRNNVNDTKPQLTILCNLSKTSIDNAISKLKQEGYIKRVGSKKTGYEVNPSSLSDTSVQLLGFTSILGSFKIKFVSSLFRSNIIAELV